MHAYKRGAKEGRFDPLLCPHCGSELVSMIDHDHDEQPMLRCFLCRLGFFLEDYFFEEMSDLIESAR